MEGEFNIHFNVKVGNSTFKSSEERAAYYLAAVEEALIGMFEFDKVIVSPELSSVTFTERLEGSKLLDATEARKKEKAGKQ